MAMSFADVAPGTNGAAAPRSAFHPTVWETNPRYAT